MAEGGEKPKIIVDARGTEKEVHQASLAPSAEAPRSEAVTGGLTLEEFLKRQTEGREKFREVPLYFGAVFKGGKNEVHVDRPEIIPTLEIKNRDDRDTFIFRNIFAFDYLWKKPESWKGVIDDWLNDEAVANLVERVDSGTIKEFEEKMKAMMAVTASARAMEKSTGVAKNYLETLVGAGPKGDPNLDAQDYWDTFLLHADPKKMEIVLADQQVRKYYETLMTDAGLVYSPDNEWAEYQDPKDPDKTVQRPSKLVWATDPESVRTSGKLIEYMKNGARGGGLQKYIEDVLVGPNLDNREVRMAAARIASDVFLVDKYTRWEFAVTTPERVPEGERPRGTHELKLQPLEDWGGDPLRSIIQPTFLPRLKNVYQGEYIELILDPIDKALGPQDYIDEIVSQKNKYEIDETKFHLMIPSMVTNMKNYSRLSDAIYKVFGGSLAKDLPSWTPDTVKELNEIAQLLAQVYGGLSVKEKSTGESVPVGKHIVGGMITRILKAKAQATTIESARPDFGDIVDTMIDPRYRERPLLEVLQLLWGPKIDARAGLFHSFKARLPIIFSKGNMFKDVKKTYYDTYDLLNTNDQAGGHYSGLVNLGGKVIRVATALGEGTGITGRRK